MRRIVCLPPNRAILHARDGKPAGDFCNATRTASRATTLPFAGSVGMTLAWVALLTVLALVRTGRRDVT